MASEKEGEKEVTVENLGDGFAKEGATSTGTNGLLESSLHLVTKKCLHGTDEVFITWFSDKMPHQKGGDQVRYMLDAYTDLRDTLLDGAVEVIKELHFGVFLEIKMHKCTERKFSQWVASICKPARCHEEEAIVFVFDENYPRVMTRHALSVLIGLPMGDQTVPQSLLEENPTPLDQVKDALKSALKTAAGKTSNWTLQDVIKTCKEAKTTNDHMLQVRLFIAAIFEFGIFTSSSLYLSAENLGRVCDLKSLVTTDWCKTLIDHMQRCLKTFDDTWRVFSPLIFTLFCLENVDCNLPNDKETPRMKYYEEGRFSDIVEAFKTGVKLKDWKNTVFGHNNIAEIQASEIKYAENYKETVKRRKVVLKEGEDPSIVLKEKKRAPKKRLNSTDHSNSNKHDQFFRADIDRDILHFYQENVRDKARDKIVLHILDHVVSEKNYVECFDLKGYMHTSIMFMQCALWNEEWKEKAIDKVILSHKAMLELLNPKQGQSTLTAELLTRDLELQANLIFIPIVHDHHWFLIVISREKTIYILDSFPSKSREPVISEILTTLRQLLGPGYISEVLKVLPQKNNYDCGFYVLLYINGFDDKKTEQICGVNKDMVEKFRIETAVHLRRHKLNKPVEVINFSNDDDDDDVEVVENSFSYDNCRFNAALDNHVSPTHSPLGYDYFQDEGNFQDDHNKLERNDDSDGVEADNTMGEENYRREKKPRQEPPKDSSDVMKSRSERQLKPPCDLYDLHDKRIRPFIKFEQLEEAYQLAIDCKEQVIEISGNSMTGPQLEKCLQGGQDARHLFIIFMEVMDPLISNMKRIFCSPVDKDDQDLEKNILAGLPFVKKRSRASALDKTIVYFPVFFSGEWIVVCFVLLSSKKQIHIFCHRNSFEEVRKFALNTMGEIISKALKTYTKMEVTFSQAKVAFTQSIINANHSAAASMYFLEHFYSTRESTQFLRFQMDSEAVQDIFLKAVKYGIVQLLLCHKKNKGKVPDSVSRLLKR